MDEEDRIRPCLESVRDLADEIVVVDGGSTDTTLAICREYTDKVFSTDWPGDGIQKQRALDKASCEWVLRIDADERMSPELRSEVAEILGREEIREVAFSGRWATYCFGEYLTHGEEGASTEWRLFRREGTTFDPRFFHARATPPPGPTGTLRGRLYHDAHRSFGHLLEKLAERAAYIPDRPRARWNGLTRALACGGWRFLKVYVLRRGFLDGRRGLMMAVLYGQHGFNKYVARWAALQPGLPRQDEWKPPAS